MNRPDEGAVLSSDEWVYNDTDPANVGCLHIVLFQGDQAYEEKQTPVSLNWSGLLTLCSLYYSTRSAASRGRSQKKKAITPETVDSSECVIQLLLEIGVNISTGRRKTIW